MAFTGVGNLNHDLFSIVFCIVLISISLQGSLIPQVAKKLDMTDSADNVMKTFNDYSEVTEMQFGSLDIAKGSHWCGKKVMELALPGNMLIAQIIRGRERITARGDTVLLPGDRVVLVTKAFDDSETFLLEKTVRKGGKLDGHAISEFQSDGLILLIRRDDEEIIPQGDTLLRAGDRLVILKSR